MLPFFTRSRRRLHVWLLFCLIRLEENELRSRAKKVVFLLLLLLLLLTAAAVQPNSVTDLTLASNEQKLTVKT